MMSAPVGGIDPHQSNFTVAVVDINGVEMAHASYANGGAGYIAAIELLSSHGVEQVGVEGSASWGSHVAIAARRGRASMPARSRRCGRRSSGDHGVWRRPTTSTRSRRRGRCWPSRHSARCRRWRCTTRWWRRSKRCSNTAACWCNCAR